MKIIGTATELDWLKNAIMNNCSGCPYKESCDEEAAEDSQKYGEVRISCQRFLDKKIEFLIKSN